MFASSLKKIIIINDFSLRNFDLISIFRWKVIAFVKIYITKKRSLISENIKAWLHNEPDCDTLPIDSPANDRS